VALLRARREVQVPKTKTNKAAPDPDAVLLTMPEAAHIARNSPRSIRRAIANGELENAAKRSRVALVRRSDLLRWLGVA
jgi:helix-turn-helix protein